MTWTDFYLAAFCAAIGGTICLSSKIGDWAWNEREREYERRHAGIKQSKIDFWNRLAAYGDGGTGPERKD